MGRLKRLPPAAGKGGLALVWIRTTILSRVVAQLGRFAAALVRVRVPIIVVSVTVLSFLFGYVTGLDKLSERQDTSTRLQAQTEPEGTVTETGVESEPAADATAAEDTNTVSGKPGGVVELPLDGAVVSGPDWARDPLSGDWIYSYDVVMESQTSGTVRSAMAGVVKSVVSNGDTWDIIVDHGDGRVIQYSELAEADVAPGITLVRGQRIGLATEDYGRFRVRLSASLAGEPCSVLDLIK